MRPATFKNRKGNQAVNQEKGKQYLKKALQLKEDCEIAHFYFGYILKIEGEAEKSEAAFNVVMRINPGNEQAKKEVDFFKFQRQKEESQPEKKKGGISSLFGRKK